MKVSVVIPAFNEEKYLAQTLESLVLQKVGFDFEVLIIDNNSKDQTAKLALSFKDKLNIRVILEKKQGRGVARARGFKEASGDIILSADADTIFYSGWLEKLSSALTGDIVAVTTSCKIVDSSTLNNAVFNFIQPVSMRLYKIFLGHYWLSGFSFGISSSAYKKSGGFDPSLQAQEDLDLSFRVAKLGKIKFINKPVIFSGRRFKNGLLAGLYPYVSTFIEAFLLKRKNIHLKNVR